MPPIGISTVRWLIPALVLWLLTRPHLKRDRHPHLRIVTHYMGAMIPFSAGRIEQGWDLEMGARTPPSDARLLPKPLKKRPSDYFKIFYADTALSGSAPATRCGLEYFGERQVLFASDFPFDAEGGAYLIRETTRALDDLNLAPSTRAAIGRGNLERLLPPVLK